MTQRQIWGLSVPTFSNGAAFADLDNNGTMDMVINNINDEALVYKNTSLKKNDSTNHYLQIKFKGDQKNIDGLGTWVDIYYDRVSTRCMRIIHTGVICQPCNPLHILVWGDHR